MESKKPQDIHIVMATRDNMPFLKHTQNLCKNQLRTKPKRKPQQMYRRWHTIYDKTNKKLHTIRQKVPTYLEKKNKLLSNSWGK